MFLMIIIVVTIVIVNMCLQTVDELRELMLSLLNSLLSAVTVGLIVTTFTNIITDNMIKVKKNNQKLREFGVEEIGTGISASKDILRLFGNKYLETYPNEIKMMFITGNTFLRRYKNEILNCIKKGNCEVKILLISTDPSNLEYIGRLDELSHQTIPYVDQVETVSLPTVKSIIDSLDEAQKGLIHIRFYRDEYRYNFRIAKYCTNTDDMVGHCWLNIQPFNMNAADYSISLKVK